MVVKNIQSQIICNYENECKSYNCWSNTSICPTCKNNKYEKPRKVDYYESKYTVFRVFTGLAFLILLMIIFL